MNIDATDYLRPGVGVIDYLLFTLNLTDIRSTPIQH